jgi:poly-beta-1,6-N-acetyl-D-glucosamine synthase
MAEILFFTCAFLVVYHYGLYPLAVITLARLRQGAGNSGRDSEPAQWPKVTLLIAAYNEQRVIAGKLRNSLELNYPGECEIIVVSDGSNDRTADIVASFADRGVVSMHESARRGKTAALNRGVAAARGEIIVFSDANNDFSHNALRALVGHFVDGRVGGVCGVKQIREADQRESSMGDSLYWRYESAVKYAEGRLGSITNADGEIFAMRKSLYKAIDESVINDDAEITFDIVRQGYRILYEPEARSIEYASIRIEDDFHVKVRMVAGGYQTLARHWRMLLPPRSWFSFAYLSHKVLRYLAPVLLISVFLLTVWLSANPVFLALLIGQIMFYGVAAYGYRRIRKYALPTLVYVPFYFSAMNLAALFGLVRFIARQQGTKWRKAER